MPASMIYGPAGRKPLQRKRTAVDGDLTPMSMKNRLAKLEKIIGRAASCPQCHGAAIRPICIYEEEPDGTQRLVQGTPPAPCPVSA
jgi:hypothetical protein